MIEYLLCVLIVQLADVSGAIQGKQRPPEKRSNPALVSLTELLASLIAGLVLWGALTMLAGVFGGTL